MPDREKVINGVEACLPSHDPECDLCPYDSIDRRCRAKLRDDVIALLKAQEPRVMTIGDLYGQDMGYYERKDEEQVWPVLIARGGPDLDATVGIVLTDAFEIKADCDLMNVTWRIWTTYPTAAQREATPWN